MEIILRPKNYSRETLVGDLLDSVKSLMGLAEVREGAEVFKIHGLSNLTGKYEVIDLLKDQWVTSRRVLKLPSRQRGV